MTYQDSRRAYLTRLARAIPRRFVSVALSHGHLPEEAERQMQAGSAMQIKIRYRQGLWKEEADYSALTSAALPVASVYRELLDRSIAPCQGEVIAFGTNSISVIFREEEHVERACQSALYAQECLRSLRETTTDFRFDMAITVSTGDLWVPIVGDIRQKMIGYSGPVARRSVALQDDTDAGQILIDRPVAEYLGARATTEVRGDDAALLLALSFTLTATPAIDTTQELLDAEPDLDQAITRLEAFVVPPLAQRLRYVPDHWRTVAELRNVVAVMCHVEGLEHGDIATARQLSEHFLAKHREFGGLILHTEGLTKGYRALTLYGLHAPYENDPERAVMASLQIIKSIEEHWRGSERKFAIRTVIHEGEVYFGAFGNEHRYGISVVGAPIQLTEELTTRPEPSQVLVTSAIASKLASNFAMTPQGELPMVNGSPLELYSVDEVTYGVSRNMQARFVSRKVAGRSTTLRELARLTDDAIDGKGGIYSLCGEVGTGKTFLLAPIVNQWMAAQGTSVIGHCRYATKSIPLAPITSMLLNLAGVHGSVLGVSERKQAHANLQRYCTGAHLEELLDLIFETPTDLQDEGAPYEMDERWERILQAIEEIVLARIKEAPILYVIEDMQHADSMTLRMAQRLASLSRDRRFMIVCTYRPTQELSDLRELVDQEFPLAQLGLRELRDAVLEFFLVQEVDEEVAIFLWERTNGNPAQLYELMGYLRDRGMLVVRRQRVCRAEKSDSAFVELVPPTMSQQALVRLNQIGAVERHLIHRAAIVGRLIPRPVIRELDPHDWQTTTLPALTHLIDEGILVPEISTTPSYRFRDDNIRMVAYSATPPESRKKLHAQVADVLERVYAGDHDRHAAVLAKHRDLAGQPMIALHWYERACRATARSLLDRDTVELAERWFELAEPLQKEERPPLQTFSQMAVRRFVATARHFGAEDALDQARVIADKYRSVMSGHEKAVCDLWHGAALQSTGQTQSAKARLSRAYESETYAAVRCDAALRMAECVAGDSAGAKRWLTRAASLVTNPDSHWADRVDLARAFQEIANNGLDQARILNAQVRDRALRAGRTRLAAVATSNLAKCDLLCGDIEDARRGFIEAQVMGRTLGSRRDVAIHELRLGTAELYSSNFDAAHRHLDSSAEVSKEIGLRAVEYEARLHLGAVEALRGDLSKGKQLCEDALALASKASLGALQPVGCMHLLHIAILQEDQQAAISRLRMCQSFSKEKLSPLLKDRLSTLRAMGRSLLRDA